MAGNSDLPRRRRRRPAVVERAGAHHGRRDGVAARVDDDFRPREELFGRSETSAPMTAAVVEGRRGAAAQLPHLGVVPRQQSSGGAADASGHRAVAVFDPVANCAAHRRHARHHRRVLSPTLAGSPVLEPDFHLYDVHAHTTPDNAMLAPQSDWHIMLCQLYYDASDITFVL